ncbi:hypothetical protein [Micromonospora tarensis]|uniref:DUF732 domain-containing protein n=1 Tax=Micromonospora tarensis TaxID=2806100 RepID=A0ABS1YB08_9ACTN|nr:hypothetical protein [Micromonospora tarensis]MBM0274514.1 hypothetical protein [Micromonospora tarensis]
MTGRNEDTGAAYRVTHGAERRWQAVAAAAGLLVALLNFSAAFGHSAPAHSGEYGRGYTENNASEYIRADGVDFREVVQELRPAAVPVPPGYSFAADADELVAGLGNEPAVIQVTAVRGTYAGWAACAWKADWLTAQAAGDKPRSAMASAMLREVPPWPLVVQTDGGGIRQQYRKVAESAEREDVSAVRDDVRDNCPRHLIGKSR